MNIRIKAWLCVGAAVLLILATFISLGVTNARMQDAQQTADVLTQVLQDAFVLQHLTSEYWRRPVERVRDQWWIKADRLAVTLGELNTKSEEEDVCRNRALDAQEGVSQLFRQTTSVLGDAGGSGPDARLSESAERFAGQLLLRMQSVVSEVSALHVYVEARRKAAMRTERRIGVACLLFLAGTLIAVSFWLERAVVERLVTLHRGTEIIGDGNLEYRVGMPAHDEVGALSRAFDDMVERLRTTMASRDELNAEVAQRRKAEEELARSNRDLEAFGYSASHDLQEPLRKIIAFSDRVSSGCRDTLDPKYQDYLDRVRNAAMRMQALINALLEYSRVTTKAKPFEQVDLRDVVDGVLADLEVRIGETGAVVNVSGLPVIDAEPTQMRQLFQNLIGNALKFQREDVSPVIDVVGEVVTLPDAGGEACRVTVRDNGIGFEPKFSDRVFQIFHRLHSRSEYAGTGIGLALCKKIADRHGGTISAESVFGEGATFTFMLPSHQPESDLEPEESDR